ncbi:ABC transporter ATP-binding protein [Microbacterium elymi]|uniref:ATP-binding cassette domain-containing protein n=1 Tax=Microbacterium elymi TaxID=2909587 RepID=A0ABY5NL92_9MICO|nr:ATP-binding cassette domain-containing protein [Microbacterium elymi]UUT35958.1 ATP-binding cassette domain-containing protein [Microbacterium elymi]
MTTQADIVAVLEHLRGERGMGMLFITHDLNLAASICDRVYVMHDGVIQEQGSARDVFGNPQAAYTRRLVEATPSLDRTAGPAAAGLRHAGVPAEPAPAPADEPILRVEGLGKSYHVAGRAPLQAVSGASFALARGGALGVVGESGSGKSTLARMIVGLERPDVGDIHIAGRDRLGAAHSRAERLARARSVQMVFQDPYLSLDPRVPVGRAIEDALRLHTGRRDAALRRRVVELLTAVGLEERHASARPRTLSGGQRQRVAIARAVAVDPDVLVMDEATSALDVSVQAQVLDLVADIRRDRGLTVVFISHDLTVVRRVCETTLVMRRGRIVEEGPTARLLEAAAAPLHAPAAGLDPAGARPRLRARALRSE